MRSLVLLLSSLLITLSAYASGPSHNAWDEHEWDVEKGRYGTRKVTIISGPTCGEHDPYYIGDTCMYEAKYKSKFSKKIRYINLFFYDYDVDYLVKDETYKVQMTYVRNSGYGKKYRLGTLLEDNAAPKGLCKKMTRDYALTGEVTLVSSSDKNSLSYRQWKKTPVINTYSYSCKKYVDKTVYKFRGLLLTQYTTNEDACDGGNTYGVILDQKGNDVAHIYDGDVYCDF